MFAQIARAIYHIQSAYHHNISPAHMRCTVSWPFFLQFLPSRKTVQILLVRFAPRVLYSLHTRSYHTEISSYHPFIAKPGGEAGLPQKRVSPLPLRWVSCSRLIVCVGAAKRYSHETLIKILAMARFIFASFA